MPIAVPRYLAVAGILIATFLISKAIWTHEPFPGEVGLNTVCAVVASCLLTASIFFGFYGFCASKTLKLEYLRWCFVCSLVLATMFFGSLLSYLTVTRTLNKFEAAPTLLPQFVDATRRFEPAENREKMAKAVYTMYGAQIPFRREDNIWNYYEPTAEDRKAYSNVLEMDHAVANLRTVSIGLVSVAVDIALYSFTTFAFGLIWLALKGPPKSN